MDDEIFKITKSLTRAKSLVEMSKERLDDIKKESKTYKIIEEYYEIIKELITALMYLNGLKTLSHQMLIVYLKENHEEFEEFEILLIDELRRLRNSIVYYGQKVEKDFLINKEKEIVTIIKKLFSIAESKLKQDG